MGKGDSRGRRSEVGYKVALHRRGSSQRDEKEKSKPSRKALTWTQLSLSFGLRSRR